MPNISRDLALIKVKADRDARAEVMRLCEIFRARIVDAGQETVVVEVTGDEEKISGMVDLLRPLGIMEMVRTGVVTMARGEHVLSANGYLSRSNGNGDWASVL